MINSVLWSKNVADKSKTLISISLVQNVVLFSEEICALGRHKGNYEKRTFSYSSYLIRVH